MFSCPVATSDTAGWVQAVGSILAILVSVLIAGYQARKQQQQTLYALEQQRRSEYLKVANTLVQIAKNALKLQKHVAAKRDSRDAIQNAAEDRLPFDMPEVYALVRALDSIELHLLPASLISSAMIVGATFRQFRIKVDMVFDTQRKMDGAAFADFFETMKQMQESMRLTVADLDEELKAAT